MDSHKTLTWNILLSYLQVYSRPLKKNKPSKENLQNIQTSDLMEITQSQLTKNVTRPVHAGQRLFPHP